MAVELGRVSSAAGGLLRLKGSLELRLGGVQREAILATYATAAMMANKNDIAKEAVRCEALVLLHCCAACHPLGQLWAAWQVQV